MTNPATLANTTLRPATTNNALCLSALATQVFLTTYATHGIRPSIAREIAANYSENRFIERIAAPNTHIIIAEKAHHLIGFAQINGFRGTPVNCCRRNCSSTQGFNVVANALGTQ